jgi:hypothetical protein
MRSAFPALALCFAVLACAAPTKPPVEAAQSDAKRAALADVVARHPARIASLFAALDLGRPELLTVKARLNVGDTVGAAEALLAHYRARPAPTWLGADFRLHAPDSGDDGAARAKAEAALDDTFTFQGVTGRAPRLAQGGLDWSHRGPRNDLEWALFLNRHFLFLPLLHAHLDRPDPRYPAFVAAAVTDWVVSRPVEDMPDERAMSASWRPMSSASRLLQSWPHAFFGFSEAPEFSDEARLLMLSSVPEQAAHLRKHHRKRHNHTIKEMAGLAHAASVWPEFKDAPAWRAYALETLAGELERQFYPDGVHQELSAHYHRSALQYYLWVKDFEAASGRPLPRAFAEALERSVDYLAHSMSPQGFGLLNNNGDLDDNRARIADLARRFDRADWLYIASGGKEGRAPQKSSALYPWAGHVIFRNGFGADAHFAFFDIGPWGAAHQHNDKLNLTLSAYGRELLVDGGRYRYTPDDPYVAHLRSTAGHNTLTIDDRGQGPDPLYSESELTEAFDSTAQAEFAIGAFTSAYPGLEGRAIHQRAVVYVRDGYWVVFDRVETDRPRTIRAHWRFAPDLTVVADGASAASIDTDTGNLRITPIGSKANLEIVRGREAPDPLGWTSPDYNDRRPASVALYTHRISKTAVFAWALTPAKGIPPQLRPHVENVSADTMTVRIGGDTISVRFTGATAVEKFHFERGAPTRGGR